MSIITNIKLSQTARDHLIKLKRITGIQHWNVLCRWAFCVSLAETSIPPKIKHPADSNVEMNWETFGSGYEEIYMALLKVRCKQDHIELTPENLAEQFRLHLHRGIGYLAGEKEQKSLADFVKRLPLELVHG